jgi:hypothetical protein
MQLLSLTCSLLFAAATQSYVIPGEPSGLISKRDASASAETQAAAYHELVARFTGDTAGTTSWPSCNLDNAKMPNSKCPTWKIYY